jgi:hypothetical protein
MAHPQEIETQMYQRGPVRTLEGKRVRHHFSKVGSRSFFPRSRRDSTILGWILD